MKILHLFAGFAASLLVTISVAAAQDKLQRFNQFDEANDRVVDHQVWDDFLGTYVKTLADGRTVVDYGAVTDADKAVLKSYISDLTSDDPTGLNKAEAFVYWVNLYNALTVDIIIDNYPLKSIRSIFSGLRPGPWQRKIAEVNGLKITLDNIEHGILRVFWSDNRVHYAVNCASIGCPNLLDRAFVVSTLDADLDEAARVFVNHPRGIDIVDGRATASSIYNWFKQDFGGNDAGIIAHLSKYAEPDLKAELAGISKINKYDYDWNLNDVE